MGIPTTQGSKGQKPAGVLTDNIGSDLGSISSNNKKNGVSNDLGILQTDKNNDAGIFNKIQEISDNIISKNELTSNIGNNLGKEFIQDDGENRLYIYR